MNLKKSLNFILQLSFSKGVFLLYKHFIALLEIGENKKKTNSFNKRFSLKIDSYGSLLTSNDLKLLLNLTFITYFS